MDKKVSIINAALTLLVTNGIHATPMSAIAKSAKTGMGTIYNYFANKDVLINAIYVDIKQKEEAILSTYSSEKPIKTQFEEYYTTIIKFYIQHPAYFQFLEQLQGSPIITPESKLLGYQAIDAVIVMLKKGKEERVLKDISLEEILQFLGGTLFSYLRWYFNNDETKPNKTMTNQMKMVWDAIKE